MDEIEEARRLFAIKEWRSKVRCDILGELFDIQRAIADEWLRGCRYFALSCSRRAGKTQLLARLIAISLLHSGRDEWTCFAARTLGIAKDLIWSELERINKRYELNWKINGSDLSITTPTGARFRLVGVDDRASIEKVRGKRFRLFICDEASTYQDALQNLFMSCVQPGLVDIRGSFILSGTPGYTCSGFWFDIATGALDENGEVKYPDYRRHHWTLRQNPHIRDADAELADIRRQNRWTEEDPVYVREYLGEWRADDSALVYAFTRARNIIPVLPVPFEPKTWLVTLGVDYGMSDHTAWVALGSPPNDQRTFVIKARKERGKLPDEVSEITEQFVKRYAPVRIVGDSGGLGKTFVEEFNRRHAAKAGIHIIPAKKADKLANIATVNGALRLANKPGGLMLLEKEAEPLAGEIQFLPWLDEARTKEHPRYANHCADSMIYSHKEHRGYLHEPVKQHVPEPRWTTLEQRLATEREAASAPWWERE